MPALIKLVHGNRNGKAFLSREFSDFWRKLQAGELDEEQLEGIPMLSSPIQGEFILYFKSLIFLVFHFTSLSSSLSHLHFLCLLLLLIFPLFLSS